MTTASDAPVYIDATMLYRWRHLAPVGIVRLERLLASHLRFRSALPTAQYVLWDRGYRFADDHERSALDDLLQQGHRPSAVPENDTPIATPNTPTRGTGPKAALRRTGLRTIGAMPEHLRPFAERAAWSAATFGIESARYARRAWVDRRAGHTAADNGSPVHRIDLSAGGDLVALGLGWEYLDHEAMYRLKRDHAFRIHMPAFDLIPVVMPQMNAGQSHLVHRYYAEMAHYADSITCISNATEAALRQFYVDESLPMPLLATNPLPDLGTAEASSATTHRLRGEQFVLTVSTVEIRKNHLLLAKIWAECERDDVRLPKLAIVGRIGWDVEELLRWVSHAPELVDRVQIYSDVDDDELVAMYRDALFTVFPSRIEGWGLPITEALGHGKVCVHATDPAQIEASQGLMPAYHPDDFIGWKREIVDLVQHPARVTQLEDVIRSSYRPRSPGEYCEAFERILTARRAG